MDNYLNNNVMLIDEYERLYSEGIRIDRVIKRFQEDNFDVYTSFDFGRFRVFIDSCLLLFNKEKLNRYMEDEYSFADFFKEMRKDSQLSYYLSYIRNEPLFTGVKRDCLFHSIGGSGKRAWDQVATIRNALVHMQYGNFGFQESGMLVFYWIYNKDKGVKKDEGIVLEPILHEFVKAFFSNYYFGIPFKTSFFMKYSLKEKRKTFGLRFYEISAKKNANKKYNGYSSNVVSDLIKQINNDRTGIISYIYSNKEMYNIKEFRIREKIKQCSYRRCVKRYQLTTRGKYYYGLKVFLDFESEISNFMVHIGQLNNILYEYSVLRKCGNYTDKQIEELRPQYEERMRELLEDEFADLAFKVGFVYLRIMNFALRTEDDDYERIDYSIVDVSKFRYEEKALSKYVVDNNISDACAQKYVIERIRNSLMHGNISCELTKKGEILFVFTDSFNKRKDVIKILLEDLKIFLQQSSLYAGIPSLTEVMLAEK